MTQKVVDAKSFLTKAHIKNLEPTIISLMLGEYCVRFSSLSLFWHLKQDKREYEKKEKTLEVVLQKQFVSGLSHCGTIGGFHYQASASLLGLQSVSFSLGRPENSVFLNEFV